MRVRLYSVIVGIATARVCSAPSAHRSSAQAPAPPQKRRSRPRPAPATTIDDGVDRRDCRRPPRQPANVSAAEPAAFSAVTEAAVQRDLRRMPQLDRAGRRPRRRALQGTGRVARRPIATQWERILAKLKSGEMPPPDVERPDAADQGAGDVPGGRVRARRRQREARSGQGHRAAFEPGRIHEHDPRSARHRLPRRQELPDRRFRRRLRQHRRDPHRVAGADGQVPVRRRRGSPNGRLPPSRCRSRSKWNTACASRTSAGWIRATWKRRIASTSTPNTSCGSACPDSGRRTPSR